MLLSTLDHADTIRVDGEFLCVTYPPSSASFKNQLEARDNRKTLEELSREVLGHPVVLSVTVGARPSASGDVKRQEAATAKEEAVKHPGVRSVVDTFQGEVIEVIKPE